MGKGEIAHYEQLFSFSHIVFKRLVLETHKNKGLFGKSNGNCSSFLSPIHAMLLVSFLVLISFFQFQIFKTDSNAPLEMLIRFMFQKPFVARKLRLQIIQPENRVCLKLEVIGCPKRGENMLWLILFSTLSQTSPGFYVFAVQVF